MMYCIENWRKISLFLVLECIAIAVKALIHPYLLKLRSITDDNTSSSTRNIEIGGLTL